VVWLNGAMYTTKTLLFPRTWTTNLKFTVDYGSLFNSGGLDHNDGSPSWTFEAM